MLSELQTETAKETSVGGTSMSSNVPLIESLPPMEAMPNSNWAVSAPSKAAAGLPHREASSVMRSKYSWNVK